jgi:3-phenylpropionate/trans-cinnamate dioxygenase ferredoxin component
MSDTTVCRFDDLAPGSATRFVIGRHRVCVVRLGDDLYAIGDVCSHEDYSLAEGELYPDDREIECWKHGSTFSLETGEPQSLPATGPVPVYEVRREGDDVVVKLP